MCVIEFEAKTCGILESISPYQSKNLISVVESEAKMHGIFISKSEPKSLAPVLRRLAGRSCGYWLAGCCSKARGNLEAFFVRSKLKAETERSCQQSPRALVARNSNLHNYARCTQRLSRKPHDLHFFHNIIVHEYNHVYVDYFNYSSTTTLTMSGTTATPPPAAAGSGSTPTTPCATTSRLPAVVALHQLRCAPRLVISRLQRAAALHQLRCAPRLVVS
jgi:hypothetical protein